MATENRQYYGITNIRNYIYENLIRKYDRKRDCYRQISDANFEKLEQVAKLSTEIINLSLINWDLSILRSNLRKVTDLSISQDDLIAIITNDLADQDQEQEQDQGQEQEQKINQQLIQSIENYCELMIDLSVATRDDVDQVMSLLIS